MKLGCIMQALVCWCVLKWDANLSLKTVLWQLAVYSRGEGVTFSCIDFILAASAWHSPVGWPCPVYGHFVAVPVLSLARCRKNSSDGSRQSFTHTYTITREPVTNRCNGLGPKLGFNFASVWLRLFMDHLQADVVTALKSRLVKAHRHMHTHNNDVPTWL